VVFCIWEAFPKLEGIARTGMRVKLSRIPKALKARSSKAQGEGARAACSGTLGLEWDSVKP